MVLTWFDAVDAEKFGQSLAQLFIKKIPLAVEKGNRKLIAKQLEVVDQMYSQIEQFKLNNKLNIYKKAKLANAFRHELITAGYKPTFIDQIVKGLMLKL